MTDKLVLVDLSGIAHPIYHANDGDSNPNATSIAIVERIRAMCSAHPHAAICCDSGRSFRKDIDPTYKANRIDADKDAERARIQHQITLAVEILRGDGFPVWSVKGFEADDLIATAVKAALPAYIEYTHVEGVAPPNIEPSEVLIISADKDMRQLVRERVEVFAPGVADRPSVTYDVAAVVEKHGVQPNQMLDYLALVGDTSDNIVGARGIGTKTAANLLNTFGNLDDLFAAIDRGEAKIAAAGLKSLAEFRPRMDTVRSLIRLRTDAPIPFEEIFKERVPQDVAVFGGDDESDMATVDSIPEAPGTSDDCGSVASDGREPSASAESGAGEHRPDVGRPDEPKVDRLARRPEVVDLAPIPSDWKLQLEPRSIQQAKALADSLFLSRNFSAYGHPAGIMATILAGRELGIQAMASLRAFHIVEGKPTMAADFIRARVLSSGLVEYFRPIERTPEIATFAIKRKGDPEFRMSYTIQEAETAGRVKPASGYKKDPADMLVARCSAKLARLVCPEITFGMYAREEMES